MRRYYRPKGVITVFLSLISVLLLSLVCTLAESARVQGARAKAAAVLDMGLFSVFGEYERKLLEKYDVLLFDGSYGSGSYDTEKVRLRMEDFMSFNSDPKRELSIKGLDLFKISLMESDVEGIMLATDENGEAFYQQAVCFMKENLGTEVIDKLLEDDEEAKSQKDAKTAYQKSEEDNERQMQEMKKEQEEQKQAEQEKDEKLQQGGEENQNEMENGQTGSPPNNVPVEVNPIEIIRQVKKMGILGLVLKDPSSLSAKTIDLSNQPSHRQLEVGNLPVHKKEKGLAADALFRRYLTDHFYNYRAVGTNTALDYQLEYLIAGKESDQENLKTVVHELLLIREGCNFVYALSNQEMQAQAEALAVAIAGAFLIPGLVTVTKMALLLAWSYGESLLDVRSLLSGGKIPLKKSPQTWKLSLENLSNILEILQGNEGMDQDGMSYEEYLQVILATGSKSNYPMRALDMVEDDLRLEESTRNFKVDACVGGMKVSARWQIPPVFMRIPAVFLGTGNVSNEYKVQGSFSY